MTALTLTILISSCFVGLALGVLFGAFPLKSTQMTRKQESYGSALSFLSLGLFLALVITKNDWASYAFIGFMLVGFGVAKIPAVHLWFVQRFKIFRPKNMRTLKKR
ncbi:hypothetical protein B9G54_03235 [Alloscardovia macacae]|uniref:Uncharacterized protein n=1 Tax=Alloscardovia macacae TaxID=1160091 RepID=A0A1Y2T1V8_9BIFI|nr:hypothetical protein [Alloscardovia macacae]OTA26811.1 hypothetical protein B9G54_03235 [Alloscardovia macacae]OTA29165.1 hypothetical protein B9T39_04610 [Alloscardovia macacae]